MNAGEIRDRRLRAYNALRLRGVAVRDPMRHKYIGFGNGEISHNFHTYAHLGPLFTSKGIMTRDHNDVMTSDIVLIDLTGCKEVSKGSLMELAWAYAYRIPTIVVMEPSGNIHDNHPMISEAIDYRVQSLEEAAEIVTSIVGV